MVSNKRVIVGLSRSASAVGWGTQFHASLDSVNPMFCARSLNARYRCEAHVMPWLLRQYTQQFYTYDIVVKDTGSRCHKDAYAQIAIGNTE